MSITKLLPRLPSVLLLALLTSALLESGGAAVLPSQSTDKVIESGNIKFRSDPLEVVSITAEGKSVKFKERFTAGEDWLRGLTVKLKNVGGKEITYIHCDLDFPETASTGTMMAYQIFNGHRPRIDNQSGPALSLAPGSEFDMVIDEKQYADVVRFLNTRQPIASINRVTLRISLIIFADGTAYNGGTFLRQDPSNPRRFIPVN